MADEVIGGGNPGGEPGGGEPGAGGAKPGDKGAPDKGTPGGGQGAGDKVYTYKEDRSDWVPRHRLNEQGTKVKEFETKATTLEGQVKELTQKLQIALGVKQVDPQEQETEEIRSTLLRMFPQMKLLENLSEERLAQIVQAAEAAQGTAQNHWQRHADVMLNQAFTRVADALGVESLSDRQKLRLRTAYREEAAASYQERKRAAEAGEQRDFSNDFISRHERGDETLITEFVKGYLEDFVEPAKRSATQQALRRQNRPVPRGERTRTPVVGKVPEVDFNDDNAFKKALIEARQG